MPGQTMNDALAHTLTPARLGGLEAAPASMEGRAIARPNDVNPAVIAETARFNGGPGNCPAKLGGVGGGCRRELLLQWRAGQLPGQTAPRAAVLLTHANSFNGGPGNCPAKPRRLPTAMGSTAVPASFNGGPGNCPAKRKHVRRTVTRTQPGFNGGPGNCPAKHIVPPKTARPGRQVAVASMEGRAIARPNPVVPSRWSACRIAPDLAGLQWRAGQLPGQTTAGIVTVTSHRAAGLQWRAGQLPGQTGVEPSIELVGVDRSCFNGGPGNCPAKIAEATRAVCFNGGPGNCPAKRLRALNDSSSQRFNGGPGNCPAKRVARRSRPPGA